MYRINVSEKDMKQIKTVSLIQEKLKEQEDLQEWIVKHPECLCDNSDDELLIIQKEFSTWDDQSKKRLDLLALDKQGNLVVIENKRDESPYDVVAQAITYASFCETMIAERIIDEYSHYLSKYKKPADAQKKICEFLGKKEIQEIKDIINRQQRIIIVAGDFPIEVTSAVLWLRNNYNLKIDCVCYHLYRDDKALYVDFDKIIPIPGAEDYQVRLAEKRREENEAKCICAEYRDYWFKVISYLEEHKELVEKGFKAKESEAKIGNSIFRFTMNKKPYDLRLTLSKKHGTVGVLVWIDTKDKKGSNFYDQISTPKMMQRINKTLGGNVDWRPNDERTISTTVPWNRDDNSEKFIEWQMNTLVAVMEVLDEVSK